MSAVVPHGRPLMDTSGLQSGLPVSATDWATLGGLANWANGHGAMLIPSAFIGAGINVATSKTFRFYVAPKVRAVERVWVLNLSLFGAKGSSATAATVTCGSAAAVTLYPQAPYARRSAFIVRESLSAKTNTVGEVAVTIAATVGGVSVESIGMYEQTRRTLDTNTIDYGVDLTTTRARQPIADLSNASSAGVQDAFDNLDSRRSGFFYWAADTGDAVAITGTGVSLVALNPPILIATTTAGTTSVPVNVAVYAKVNAGTASVDFSSTQLGGATSLSITSTSFGWVTGSLSATSEDLTTIDGRRSATWETMAITGSKGTATTLSVAGISIYRSTTPL